MNTLANNYLTINIKSSGAELTSIKNNKTGIEYLWQADPAFWKRHSPVLFPIVGSVWNNEYRNNGVVFNMSQHGFARDEDFELLTATSSEVFYQLKSNEDSLKKYPFPFQLQIGYKLTDNRIEVMWSVKNTGSSTMYFQIGAHPAFNYPGFDPSSETKGYFSFGNAKDLNYILITDQGYALPDTHYSLELKDGLLPIVGDTFTKSALIFENSQLTQISLLDKAKQPYVTMHFNTPVVALWSPSINGAPFACIEPWYGRCDTVGYEGEFKNKDWMNFLEAGETFNSSYVIEIEL